MVVCSCTEKKFHIRGNIADAEGKTLYLENMGLDGVVAIDSTKLPSSGDFSFSRRRNEAPEFYRLRVESQIINLAIDSTETVVVKAKAPSMAYDYEVEGSDDCSKIKELALLQMNLQAKINEIINDPTLKLSQAPDSIASVMNAYKEYVKTNYIYKAPNRAYAYFALFQTIVIGNTYALIFNPRINEDDIKAFAAVGTSWDTYYPNSVRGENLHNIVIENMKNLGVIRAKAAQTISPDKIDYSGVVDLELLDNKGNMRKLSDLKGKVVMLDFCSLAQEGTTERIMAMRDVYNKYHDRGFEIYQVSIDGNEHFWKTQTAALPWVSVNDPDGATSGCLMLYNVQSLPTFFLLQKDCTPLKRDAQIEDLYKEIESLL